jgi:protein SCO1/2
MHRVRHAIAVLASVLLPLVLFASCAKPSLVGTDLGAGPAPDFTLIDGISGRTVTLSSLRGGAVAIAFLYTSCPDVCPLTAERFRAAQRMLGGGDTHVTFVAVSVDPEHDTPEATRAFSIAHGLSERWYYLIGPRPALQAVWSAYGVGAISTGTPIVEHNDAIFVIDRRGRERVLMHSDQPAEDLASNLRALLKEGD